MSVLEGRVMFSYILKTLLKILWTVAQLNPAGLISCQTDALIRPSGIVAQNEQLD